MKIKIIQHFPTRPVKITIADIAVAKANAFYTTILYADGELSGTIPCPYDGTLEIVALSSE